MAKYSKCEEEVQAIVQEVASELGLEQFMEFEALYVNKQSEPVVVTRANKLAEFLSNRSDLVVVLIYGKCFDLVDDKTKYLWIRLAMDQIAFDSEKDKILIGCPMVSVPVGAYEKMGKVATDAALLGQLTIQQIQDKEKEEKQKAKEEKKNRKKQTV